MKKIIWSTLIGVCFLTSLSAQDTIPIPDNDRVPSKNIIKVYPLSALAGIIGLGYERVIKPKTTLNFALFQQFNDPNFDNNQFEKNYHLFFEPELRRYLSKRKKALEGWFVSGSVLTEYNNYQKSSDTQINDIERLWIGSAIKTGYQWVFKKALKGITTEVNGGIDYRTTTGVFDGGNLSEFNLRLHFTIGYSW